MEKIELTPVELKVLRKDIAGRFFPMTASDEELKAMENVIDIADNLLRKYDAYDELNKYQDMSSMKWLYDKYKEQQEK